MMLRRVILLTGAMLLLAGGAVAQVVIPGAGLRCAASDDILKMLKDRFAEVPRYSGVEVTTQIPFTWYLNLEKGTSTYVTFPQPGIACFMGGNKVTWVKRESDL